MTRPTALTLSCDELRLVYDALDWVSASADALDWLGEPDQVRQHLRRILGRLGDLETT